MKRIKNLIPVEIKAISVLENTDLAQSINYLEAFNLDTELLINFGNTGLQCKETGAPKLLRRNC